MTERERDYTVVVCYSDLPDHLKAGVINKDAATDFFREWCRENCQDHFAFGWTSAARISKPEPGIIVRFFNPTDAILFKLTWNGIEDEWAKVKKTPLDFSDL